MSFHDVAFLHSRASFSTTCHKIVVGGKILGITTCHKTVIGGTIGHALD